MPETAPTRVRNEWPEHLAWPKAPEGCHAFNIRITPKYEPGTPPKQRPPYRSVRLRDLSFQELTWVAMTVSTELRRRNYRPADEAVS